MKQYTRIISFLLCFIMLMSMIPAVTVSAAEADSKIVTATDLFYAYASGSTLTTSIEEDESGKYVHFVAAPGEYGNNDLIVSFAHHQIVALDYPYIVVGFRTNSQSNVVDVGQRNIKGENWMNLTPAQTNNGQWSTLYLNINDISDNTTPNLPAEDEIGVSIRLKPWKAHGKTLTTEQYYDLRYVAYFKTEAAAKAFKFDPNAEYETDIDLEMMENIPYYEADQATIDKYMAEADALKESIINSETTVTWTGTAYYISNKGDDNNDGLTPATAWKSVSKISGADFLKEGDAVLFERGGAYRYEGSLSTRKGVTYSAYGTGAKPKLIGSVDASTESMWRETEVENVYEFTGKFGGAGHDVGQIVFDMGRAWGIKLQNGLYIGTNSNGLEMIETGTPNITGPEGLHGDLEYWHDWNSDTLYLYSKDGNPASRFSSIEIVDQGNGINGNANGVTIDNLALFGFGSHGIGYGGIGDSAPQGLTVQYCTFSFIGGSRQYTDPAKNTRFGNAVEIYGGCKDFVIHDCYANNIYDCCWTVQYQSDSNGVDVWFENVEFYNNVACYSNTGLEVWLNNKPEYNNDATYGMKNLHLHDNYTYYNGYGWSQQRPNKDGNIFYGDPSVTTTVYENCSVDNNVGMFASNWILYVRYTGSSHYNFNNNIYFQHNNKLFGGVASNPEGGVGNIGQYKYDEPTMSRLLSSGFEKGSTFYYVESDYEIPQYTPDVMNFSDVPEEHWAYDYIEAAVMRNYFNGTAPNIFSPDSSMTRAMLVTVLSRITDEKINIEKAPYSDVNQSAWYASSVNWAYSAGLIANGVTSFRPDDAVTREEMADMLYRLTLNQYKTTDHEGKALTFSDSASVSKEYAAGIAFATENGIISGYTDGSVKPNNTATRAEVATMIKRFVSLYDSLEADFSKISTKTDSIVFSGNELSSIVATSFGDKRIVTSDSGDTLVRIIPQHPSQSSLAPRVLVFEKISKVNFADYPYVKIRLKTSGNPTSFDITLTKNGVTGTVSVEQTPNEWTEAIACIYDMVKPGSTYDGELNGSFYISPWAGGKQPTYNVDTCDIEHIGFFPTKDAALNY